MFFQKMLFRGHLVAPEPFFIWAMNSPMLFRGHLVAPEPFFIWAMNRRESVGGNSIKYKVFARGAKSRGHKFR